MSRVVVVNKRSVAGIDGRFKSLCDSYESVITDSSSLHFDRIESVALRNRTELTFT